MFLRADFVIETFCSLSITTAANTGMINQNSILHQNIIVGPVGSEVGHACRTYIVYVFDDARTGFPLNYVQL